MPVPARVRHLARFGVVLVLGAGSSDSAAAQARPQHSPVDVLFMQGMIVHHAQALEMAALAPGRAGSEDLRLLATRIDVSQRDEIAMMQQWLTRRGAPVVAAEHHGDAAHGTMPGMASPEEVRRLAASRGAEFDRLFLELMIRHHEGALVMVAELFATNGAGQEPELFRFASDVDADQRMEIARMRRLLDTLPQRGST